MNMMVQDSGNRFIDENHHDLLNHLAALEASPEADCEEAFRRFVRDMENHFHHEETILLGVDFDGLDNHTLEHRRIAIDFHEKLNVSPGTLDKSSTIAEVRVLVFEHEMTSDQAFWSLFEGDDQSEPLLRWDDSLETGIEAIDFHHQALTRYINRFYLSVSGNNSRQTVRNELEVLKSYAKYHFQVEEQSMTIGPQHKANHQTLLRDLDVLMVEFEKGCYQIESLRDYFDYWLFNHIRVHDVPAARDL